MFLTGTVNAGTMIPLHIHEQNAGVILSRIETGILFEAFELCPLNHAAMSTKGRLCRYFPGPAVVIPTATFDDAEFQSTLAKTLSKMCIQKAIGMTPTVRKSKNNVQETRDTTHPRLVTELLFSMLSAFSSPANTQRIQKNTREDVLWKDALLPWRRSPLWLLVRVSVQLQFTRFYASTAAGGLGTRLYKLFILHIQATILDSCLRSEDKLAAEKLHCMIAKMVGRMLKLDLDETDKEPGISFAKQVLEQAKAHLELRWAVVRKTMSDHLDLEQLKNLDFKNNITLSLPQLDSFLARIPNRESAKGGINLTLDPNLLEFSAETLPRLNFDIKERYKIHNLHAFEKWTAFHLSGWTQNHISEASTCRSIRILMVNYYNEAHRLYSADPEASSTMYLTLLELWMACDKSAVANFPLLADYDPGVPKNHLRYLLLPLREQMERLHNLELYLEKRSKKARYGTPGSIFTDIGRATSFSARFFDQSSEHQELRQSIERDAILQRQCKRRELSDKKQEYSNHMRSYDQLACDYVERKNQWGDIVSEHSSSCRRHHHLNQAKAIKISVHEWPLPQDIDQLKSVVFELKPPPAFCDWRNATLCLLLRILGSEYATEIRPEYNYRLANCQLLAGYYNGGSHRVCLLSEVKPHVVCHRKMPSIPETTEQDICLNNGPKFCYFDTDMECFTSNITPTEAILEKCTYNLPNASSLLRQFIYRRFNDQDSMPNDVIVTQSECPAHLSLAEYRALASIPIGYRIGWESILVQIRSPLIDLKKPEASLVVFQTMYQAGPLEGNTAYRASHSVLANCDFTSSLLSAIRESATRIEENWESCHALGLLISITCRQLSLIPSPSFITDIIRLLSDLRGIAAKWIDCIKKKYQEAQNDIQRIEFREKIVQAALVCCGTFDVDDEHLETILYGVDGQAQASILIHCGILIHDNHSSKYSETHRSLLRLLYRRWQKLSFRAYPLLANLILKRAMPCCLDEAIKVHWPAYDPGDVWGLARNGIEYCVSSNTSCRSGLSMRLHYNLLTGSLLVNGLPLSRLPLEYEQHSTYSELFGQTVFQIIPSSTPGMRFCVQELHQGYSVQLGLAIPDLLIQATKDNRTFEVLPRGLFRNRLPTTFVEDYSHWYDAASNMVVFRNRSTPWKTSNSSWILSRGKDNSGWRLEKNGTRLISPTSLTGTTVTSIFASIQAPLQIKIVLANNNEHLEVELPELQLEFYLKGGTNSMVSRKLRGLEVDCNQSIGTLVGLKTKLVLRDPLSGDRKVLIPAGSVLVSRDRGHVSAIITSARTSPFVYKVDQLLQRLTDNGGLQSKLFLCYLHGLTSFCLPDPLTCRTGTEQALCILKSSAVKSFPLLTAENLSLFQRIDSLTPRRTYYPAHEKVMQTVKWNDSLPSLSQHPHFHNAVEEILHHYQSTQLFHPNEYVRPPSIDGVSQLLLSRDASRTSRFRVSCFGAEDFISTSDSVYAARDNGQSNQAQEAQVIAIMMFRRDGVLYRKPSCYKNLADHILKKLKNVGRVNGPSIPPSSLPALEYDSQWLEDKQPEYWAQLWCWLHQNTRKQLHISLSRKFQVIMWFATMAFALKADLDLLHAAATMFLDAEIRAIEPVKKHSFKLCDGDTVNSNALRGAVSQAALPFEKSPEKYISLPVIRGETRQSQWERRNRLHRENKGNALTQFVRHLSDQFPTSTPVPPTDSAENYISKYINIAKAMLAVVPLFTTWNDNRLFAEYIRRFGGVLDSHIYQFLQVPKFCFNPPTFSTSVRHIVITSENFFATTPHGTVRQSPRLETERLIVQHCVGGAQRHLEALLRRLECRPGSKYQQQYAIELRESADELNSGSKSLEDVLGIETSQLRLVLEEHLIDSEKYMNRIFDAILNSIRAGLGKRAFAERLFQVPRLSSTFLLQQLSNHGWAVGGGWSTLPLTWKTWIVGYGKAVAQVQRAKRLLQCLNEDRESDLLRELQSESHTNWSPLRYPEALLLEIENNITIREVQADIAEQMMYVILFLTIFVQPYLLRSLWRISACLGLGFGR